MVQSASGLLNSMEVGMRLSISCFASAACSVHTARILNLPDTKAQVVLPKCGVKRRPQQNLVTELCDRQRMYVMPCETGSQ